jgi:multidrug transporter EmrE-like cation transporter
LLFQYATKQLQFAWKHLIAGVVIGIPNYFSIWCLVRFLKNSRWESSASFPVNNMGIVLFSSVVAWLLFKERLSKINWLGVALSLLAISLIAFGNKS